MPKFFSKAAPNNLANNLDELPHLDDTPQLRRTINGLPESYESRETGVRYTHVRFDLTHPSNSDLDRIDVAPSPTGCCIIL